MSRELRVDRLNSLGDRRARASFLGTVEFSPSSSGYASILVARPLSDA